MYIYYSSGQMNYVLLLLKLNMHTHFFMPQIDLNLLVSPKNYEVILTNASHGNMTVLFVQRYC